MHDLHATEPWLALHPDLEIIAHHDGEHGRDYHERIHAPFRADVLHDIDEDMAFEPIHQHPMDLHTAAKILGHDIEPDRYAAGSPHEAPSIVTVREIIRLLKQHGARTNEDQALATALSGWLRRYPDIRQQLTLAERSTADMLAARS
jgi:hypothetical protein